MKRLTDIEVIEGIPPVFDRDDMVCLDLESFGMKSGKLHRPIGTFACLAVTGDGHTVYEITDQADLPLILLAVEQALLVFQNAPFDVFHLRRFGMNIPSTIRLHDTLYFDRILYNGLYDEYNLKALTRRHLGLYMEKETRKEFEKAKELTSDMLFYNAVDAAAQWRIAYKQIKAAKASDMRTWKEVDCPAVWTFMDFKGPKLDVKRWKEIAEENKRIAEAEFGGFPFNPRSPAQVKKYLNEVEGLNLEKTNVKNLEPHLNVPIVASLLAYRKVEKRRSTYGLNWLKNYVEDDDRVYPFYDVNMAETGRTATRNPTIQNIPIRETPVFRECFVADEGNILIGGDYSQQEVRIVAWFGNDTALINIFNRGGDVYAEMAKDVYKVTEVTKDKRDKTKATVLGLMYGMSAYGLAQRLDTPEDHWTEEKAERFINHFFKLFPGVKAYRDHQNEATRFVKTAVGRRSWINLRTSQGKRNAYNSPIQGTAGDMLKVAMILLHEQWGKPVTFDGMTLEIITPESFPAILEIHDEIVLEVKKENESYAKLLLRKCMIEAGNKIIPGIPIVVEIKVGDNWSQTH